MLSDEIVISADRALARSYAKINLTLDVLGKREDGYHSVNMIMQTVSLFDSLVIDKSDRIAVSTNLKYLPVNNKNLAYRAVELFREYTGLNSGAKIIIHKNIPVAAGLAGGSGNAAAVLCALNLLYNTGLTETEICGLGAKLGADVPYCVKGGTQLASGIGDILTPAPKMPNAVILLVKPKVSVSTKLIYDEIDNAVVLKRPDTNKMINALRDGDLNGISNNLCNIMESVTQNMHPQISGIKNKMLLNGALGAVMSGSGPTVFGIFDDYKKAKISADSFAYQYKDVFLTRIHN